VIAKLYGNKIAKVEKLSPATLDTLAIVAYKQPLTRADIETIRGVACGQILRQLMERGLVKTAGRKMDTLGYPTLYATTEQFLKEFGLATLAELPLLAELRQMKILADETPTAETAPTSSTETADAIPVGAENDTEKNYMPIEPPSEDDEDDDDEEENESEEDDEGEEIPDEDDEESDEEDESDDDDDDDDFDDDFDEDDDEEEDDDEDENEDIDDDEE
jgi:segregation and condensation protein B